MAIIMKRARILLSCGVIPLIITCGVEPDSPPIAPESMSLEETTCETALEGGEAEIGVLFILAYGVEAGRTGQDEQTVLRIEDSIQAAIAQCEQSPDALLLDTFRRHQGG